MQQLLTDTFLQPSENKDFTFILHYLEACAQHLIFCLSQKPLLPFCPTFLVARCSQILMAKSCLVPAVFSALCHLALPQLLLWLS